MEINIDLYPFNHETKTIDSTNLNTLTLKYIPVGAKVYGASAILLEIDGNQYVVSGHQLAKALEALK